MNASISGLRCGATTNLHMTFTAGPDREFGIYRDYYADHMEALRKAPAARDRTQRKGALL